jgi:hypothetical protein
MITNTVPQKGEIWQHFRGNQYKILGVARTEEISKEKTLAKFLYLAKHTEDSVKFSVYDLAGELLINKHPEDLILGDKYVIYQDIHNESKIWARKLKNFLELIPKNFHQHHYRFLRIKGID